MSKINVLYQSSSAYVIPAAVSMCSLFENNQNIDEINIWFIDVGLTVEDKNGLCELVNRYSRKIVFISSKETDQTLSEAGVNLWSGSYATFYKIFTCSQLTEIDSLLYIDADTLILDSIQVLCDIKLDGYACAMVGSGMTNTIKEFMGVKDYHNAGIIYFNLKYWRENNVEEDFLSIINGNKCSKYTIVGDETLINYVLKDRIKMLPLKYNFESSWWLWGWNCKLYKKLGWECLEESYYSPAEIYEAKEKPVIAHYVDLTTGRPWDYLNDNLFRSEFEEYSAILKPWKEIDFAMRGIGGNNKLIAKLKYLIKKLLPFSLRSRLGFYQHDNYWKGKVNEISG